MLGDRERYPNRIPVIVEKCIGSDIDNIDKLITKIENTENIIKKLDLKKIDKKKYYDKSFSLGIPQIDLNKLKDKIFGIENNLDELNGIDFKKGCYVGQENTSRIKLRNKLRRRILPVKKIAGEILENDMIKYKNSEIGKIMINKPHPFALIKVVDSVTDTAKRSGLKDSTFSTNESYMLSFLATIPW